MKYLFAVGIAWLLAVVNVSALPYLKVLGVTPDLVLIFAACWAVLRPQEEALIVVPLAGLVRDLLTGDPLGTSVIGFAPLVFLAASIRVRAVDTQFFPALMVVAAGTAIYEPVRMLVLAASGQRMEWLEAMIDVAVPMVAVNCLFTPVLYGPVSWFSGATREGIMGRRRITSPL